MGRRLEQKVAVITGAGSGIGRAAAALFAAEGARVVVADISARKAAETVSILKERGLEAVPAVVDVASPAGAQAMIQTAVTTYGRLDILFNNAGTIRPGAAPDLAEEDWDLVLATNLKAVYLAAKHAVPIMAANGGGAIINTASVSGLWGDRANVAYSTSKAGVINLTRCLAVDHAAQGIRANVICPGVVDTAGIRRVYQDPEQHAWLSQRHPLGRLARPEEIAAVALFLASDESSFMTGSVITVDGGLTAGSTLHRGGGQ